MSWNSPTKLITVIQSSRHVPGAEKGIHTRKASSFKCKSNQHMTTAKVIFPFGTKNFVKKELLVNQSNPCVPQKYKKHYDQSFLAKPSGQTAAKAMSFFLVDPTPYFNSVSGFSFCLTPTHPTPTDTALNLAIRVYFSALIMPLKVLVCMHWMAHIDSLVFTLISWSLFLTAADV